MIHVLIYNAFLDAQQTRIPSLHNMVYIIFVLNCQKLRFGKIILEHLCTMYYIYYIPLFGHRNNMSVISFFTGG